MAFQNLTTAIRAERPETSAVQRLLTVPQVAERLGVSTRKTWRLIAQGQLRAVRVGARGTRVLDGEVDTFIAGLPGQSVG
jgi:excisionase family DNA binding protein